MSIMQKLADFFADEDAKADRMRARLSAAEAEVARITAEIGTLVLDAETASGKSAKDAAKRLEAARRDLEPAKQRVAELASAIAVMDDHRAAEVARMEAEGETERQEAVKIAFDDLGHAGAEVDALMDALAVAYGKAVEAKARVVAAVGASSVASSFARAEGMFMPCLEDKIRKAVGSTVGRWFPPELLTWSNHLPKIDLVRPPTKKRA